MNCMDEPSELNREKKVRKDKKTVKGNGKDKQGKAVLIEAVFAYCCVAETTGK